MREKSFRTMARIDQEAAPEFAAGAPLIVVGSARLPKSVSGEQPDTLIIELSLDLRCGRVVDVGSTLPLPAYADMLHSLLVGRRLDELEEAAQELSAHLRGPLLRPTIAALASCFLHSKDCHPEFGPDSQRTT